MKLRSRTLRKIVPRDLPRPIKLLDLRFELPKSWEEGELSRSGSHFVLKVECKKDVIISDIILNLKGEKVSYFVS